MSNGSAYEKQIEYLGPPEEIFPYDPPAPPHIEYRDNPACDTGKEFRVNGGPWECNNLAYPTAVELEEFPCGGGQIFTLESGAQVCAIESETKPPEYTPPPSNSTITYRANAACSTGQEFSIDGGPWQCNGVTGIDDPPPYVDPTACPDNFMWNPTTETCISLFGGNPEPVIQTVTPTPTGNGNQTPDPAATGILGGIIGADGKIFGIEPLYLAIGGIAAFFLMGSGGKK